MGTFPSLLWGVGRIKRAHFHESRVRDVRDGEGWDLGRSPGPQRDTARRVPDVIRGFCSNVHVHVRRIPLEDVPKDEAAFGPWLHEQFVQRDR